MKYIIIRKKLFAHAKIHNNKVECANLLLFAHANGDFNRKSRSSSEINII